eukprot:7054495-Prymnesium_polylepis.1
MLSAAAHPPIAATPWSDPGLWGAPAASPPATAPPAASLSALLSGALAAAPAQAPPNMLPASVAYERTRGGAPLGGGG